jgi:hypothetical protein
MTALATSVNPYVAALLPILTLVLGAVLTYVLRERSARSDREHADRAELRRWERQERRAVYARFVEANDKAYNAAATAKRQTGPSGQLALTDEGRVSVEAAYSDAATLLAEMKLLCEEDSAVVAAAEELLGFHQGMVRAALEEGSWVPDANLTSNVLTQKFISLARQELTGSTP